MIRLCALFSLLLLASPALHAETPATASHVAEARRFLQLTRVDKLTVPAYAQVQQMFARRFAQAQGKDSQKPVLERYQAQANAALDQVVGWKTLEPELLELYTRAFSEAELKELVAFYQTPLGSKVLERMPQLMAMSAQLTQTRLQQAVPEVDKLLGEMNAELKQ